MQQTPEWFQQRVGKATASRIKDVVAKTKTGASASRKNYAVEIALERLTGSKKDGFTNAAMKVGMYQEPNAKQAYDSRTGRVLNDLGFIDHPMIPMSGASPDGLVGEGLIEIKCPNSATHLDNLVRGSADPEYLPQMYWQMAVTGRPWCDFVSFDPRFPEHLQLAIYRVNTDSQ